MKGIAPKNRELLETAGLNDIYKSAEHDTDDLMIKVAEANWNSRIVKQAPPHSNILN